MLLASNFLLWKNVAPVPMYASLDEYGEMSIYDLLDHVTILSHNVSELTAEMHRIFVSTSLWVSDKMGLQASYCRALWFTRKHATAYLDAIC